MRVDIYEGVSNYRMEDIKPNYAELSRRFNCDPRTVKKYYIGQGSKERKPGNRPSKLDPYRLIIKDKLDLGCSAKSIYLFILKKGYPGKYTILKEYCRLIKGDELKKATIRIETNPGLSAQVDWKEDFQMITRQGQVITFNIFLFILGFSRFKFIEPTFDRNQSTLFESLSYAFEAIGGVPREIWFDNMRTVVDQPRTQYQKVTFNQTFYYFSKDYNFIPIACRSYRPQTKGKVEALARLTERLRVYNYEIDDISDIYSIIHTFMIEINEEISQATDYPPVDLLLKEKEHFSPLPPSDILHSYQSKSVTRIVSKESMVMFGRKKYSVPTKYIGETLDLKIVSDELHLYYNQTFVKSHLLSDKPYNYDKEDLIEILKSDVLEGRSDSDIETFIEENLKSYDEL